jgi:hypothetical protein
MVNSPFSTRTGPHDLGFERGNALVKLLDRKRIEILLRQLAEQIVLSAWEILVEFHHGTASRAAPAMSIRPCPIRQ